MEQQAQLEECLGLLQDRDVTLLLDGAGDRGDGRRALLEFLLEHDFESEEEADLFYITNITATVVVICCVGIVAGLFLGLMTLDAFELQVIKRSSLDEDERKYAAALYPIVKDRHLLLVTLLILNALAYEALPIFLDKMVPSWLAIVLSTTLILLFGEILPSAIFIGPQQLRLGYYMVPFVKVLLVALYPIAFPCSLLLDVLVHGPEGPDETQEEYNRGELAALVNIQYEQRQKKHRPGTSIKERTFPLHRHSPDKKFQERVPSSPWVALKKEMLEAVNDRLGNDEDGGLALGEDEESPQLEKELTAPMEKQEVDVVVGALQMKTRVATDVFTPRSQVYSVPDDLVLDREGMTEIYAKGYSRVPVYRNNPDLDEETNQSCIMGFLMTHQLMLIDWDHEREVKTLPLVRPVCVSPRRNLVDLLNLLRSGGSLMAFVCARPDLANRALLAENPLPVEAGFMGIITLEDILESILQTRIYDERDIRERERAVATLTKWAAEKLQKFARRSVVRRRSIPPPPPARRSTPSVEPLSETSPLLVGK